MREEEGGIGKRPAREPGIPGEERKREKQDARDGGKRERGREREGKQSGGGMEKRGEKIAWDRVVCTSKENLFFFIFFSTRANRNREVSGSIAFYRKNQFV